MKRKCSFEAVMLNFYVLCLVIFHQISVFRAYSAVASSPGLLACSYLFTTLP